MKINIPGYKKLNIDKIIFDYNGTLAVKGKIDSSTKSKLIELSKNYELYILTSDTYKTVEKICENLPVKVHTFNGDNASISKRDIVLELNPDTCACIGNGRNDMEMLKIAALSVGIIGQEGAYGKIVNISDICVTSILDSMDLFIYTDRLIADLRG
ncbi:HAD family hydrolase [Miniphocaeibacter halophilus]|uniref:ATPase P n=1 Tax=Miniphocaeibacter halophilus TaxID=2931922 RepID=A0AC61N2U1_9FIRM|nr:hypothetical protein [Miniphocaeibacter halophilus]QQK08928.1 ATPase P [Miniphocaeibacter halophilus]